LFITISENQDLQKRQLTPTVVLNDTSKPHQIKNTVNPQKSNLTERFLRSGENAWQQTAWDRS
jgi:hypothetical protein